MPRYAWITAGAAECDKLAPGQPYPAGQVQVEAEVCEPKRLTAGAAEADGLADGQGRHVVDQLDDLWKEEAAVQ